MSENQLNKAAQEQEAPEQDINILKKDRIDKLSERAVLTLFR